MPMLAELAYQIADSQVDKSTYHTWYDKKMPYTDYEYYRLLVSYCSAFKEITAGSYQR